MGITHQVICNWGKVPGRMRYPSVNEWVKEKHREGMIITRANQRVIQKLMQQLQMWGVHEPQRDAPTVLLQTAVPLASPANTFEWNPWSHYWDEEVLEAVPLLSPWKRNHTAWWHIVNLPSSTLIQISTLWNSSNISAKVLMQPIKCSGLYITQDPQKTECQRDYSPHPTHSKVACPVPFQ